MTTTNNSPASIADAVIAENPALAALRPVIVKEIYHYYILSAMRERGYLDELVFQGGTSLRLCHNSPRYSEDLDFAGGTDFSANELQDLGTMLERTLSSIAPDTHVRVVDPKKDGLINRWRIRIRTAQQSKDMPSQIIKLEIAGVPSYDPQPSIARVNYGQLNSLFMPIPLTVESREEIMADKMLAFVAADYVRYRDLWDLGWLCSSSGMDTDHLYEMLDAKQHDYAEEPQWSERLQSDRNILSIMNSSQFSEELSRFIEPRTAQLTVLSPLWQQATSMELTALFQAYEQHYESTKHNQ